MTGASHSNYSMTLLRARAGAAQQLRTFVPEGFVPVLVATRGKNVCPFAGTAEQQH
jgi:hypothetical protein